MKIWSAIVAAIALLFAWTPDPNKAIGWTTNCSEFHINLYGFGSEYQCHGDYTQIYVQFNPPRYRKTFYSKEKSWELMPDAMKARALN